MRWRLRRFQLHACSRCNIRTVTLNEVSCRVLDMFFVALRQKDAPLSSLLEGVPYTIEHLRDKGERINWDAFLQVLYNARRILKDEDFISLGNVFLRSPAARPLSLVARLMFSPKEFYRWAYTPGKGAGSQLFSCIEPHFEELSGNVVRLSLELHDGYAPWPREFLLICVSILTEMSRFVGAGPARVETIETSRGCEFVVQLPPRKVSLSRVRKILSWPSTIRAAGRELKEANEVLQARYQQLEAAHRLLDRQATALRTAHTIGCIVHGELALGPTLESVVDAMVEVGGFLGAALNVDSDLGGHEIHITATQGRTWSEVEPTIIPIVIADHPVGEMRLWSITRQPEGREEMVKYVTPAVTMAIDDALKYTALADLQNTLEQRVVQRTEELARVRDELTQTIGELKKAQAARNRLFANISHEFRTPLTLIKGPIEQLLAGELRGNEHAQYQLIRRHCSRLLQLVNQLLDLSKIESGQMKLRAWEFELGELARNMVAAFESTAKRREMNLTVDSPAEPIVGWFDRDCVEKILTNLLSNAFKFTLDGGEVSVTVRHTPDLSNVAEIVVADSGIGIPEDKLDKIFDRFFQVDSSQTREHEGTGIGLALTKELVELHKGEISVTSQLGRGSSFVVRLPLDKEHLSPDDLVQTQKEVQSERALNADYEEPLRAQIEAEEVHVDHTLPLLLIVEDNADLRKHMRSYMAKSYRIVEAVNGEAGIQLAVDSIPDILITDVMMPRIDGFEVCRRLKADERTSHIPIILLTAKAGSDQKLEGLETGADDYITKPFDSQELLARAKNLIEQRRKLREIFRREGSFRLQEFAVTSTDERFLKRAFETVQQHLSEQGFKTETFARQMFMSRMQLHRKIRALTDLSPGEFVRRVRMERASQLLKHHAGTVAEIGYQVGYEDSSRFAEAFRIQFGVLPSEFRKDKGGRS